MNAMEKRPKGLSIVGLFLGLLLVLANPAPSQDSESTSGQDLFLSNRCNTCHAVASVEITAKSQKAAGPDLGGYEVEDFDLLARFLRKEEELAGEEHTKTFKGSDEDLRIIVDWLLGLEPAEEPNP